MPKLVEMGQIATVGPDGDSYKYPMALVIEFDSVESIRQAINEGVCRWDDDEEEPERLVFSEPNEASRYEGAE